jgi:hypothetical protein
VSGVKSGKKTKGNHVKAKNPTELQEGAILASLKAKRTYEQIKEETGVGLNYIGRVRKKHQEEITAFYEEQDRLMNERLLQSLEANRGRLATNVEKAGLLIEMTLSAALAFHEKGKPDDLFETTSILEGESFKGTYSERRKEPPIGLSDLIKLHAEMMKGIFAINEDGRKQKGSA